MKQFTLFTIASVVITGFVIYIFIAGIAFAFHFLAVIFVLVVSVTVIEFILRKP